MRPLLSAVLILALTGCAPAPEEGVGGATVHELPSPAPEGSGEPYLSSTGDGVYLSWLQKATDGGHELRVARLDADGWEEPATVARRSDFFVNWADFPSVAVGGDGRLWAHWLEKQAAPGLAYSVRVVHSSDEGATWSEPWSPHEDGTPTEHGFVSLFPLEGGIGLTWLDGRKYAPGPEGREPAREMEVRFRTAGGAGGPGPEVVLDPRACDCCQTDVALSAEGPVAVYRDRSPDEVRDNYVTRWTPDGWSEGVAVHADGWVTAACPVNGPAVDAAGMRVVVAWFSAAADEPRVQVTFSSDGGRTFSAPVRLDAGAPAGRVDVRLDRDGSAHVSWLERSQGDGAELRLAKLAPDGRAPEVLTISSSSAARAAGFPRMALPPWSPGSVLLAWTDVSDPERSRVRVAIVEEAR